MLKPHEETLEEAVNHVQSIIELSQFAEMLANDFIANQDSWENIRVDQYLAAMSAWLAAQLQLTTETAKIAYNSNKQLVNLLARSMLAPKYYE
jgi:hypothetical protein